MDAHSRRNIHRRQKAGGLLDPILETTTKDKPTSASSVAPSSKPVASSSVSPSRSSESSTSSAPPSPTSEIPAVITTPPAPVTSFVPGRTQVVTAGAQSTSFVAPSSTNTSSAQTAFLDNKVLSGVLFTFVGIIGFFLVVFVATFFIRRRRNKRLVDEAVAFDPSTVASYEDAEKGKMSSSSVGHGSATENAPEVQHAPNFDQYVPPVPYLPPHTTIQNGQPLYMNPAASQSQASQVFVAPESWGSPALSQGPQSTLVHTNISRPSSDDGNHRQQQHHTSSRSSSGEMKFAPTVPPDMRRYYDNK